MSTTFTDKYGDPLEVEADLDGDVCINVTEDGVYTSVVYGPEEAEKIAKAILEAAGKNVVELSTLKPASEISFNEAIMRLAVVHKRTVKFSYAKDKGDFIESRRLNPSKVNDAYVDGIDPDRDAPRRYRFDRIKGEVSFA